MKSLRLVLVAFVAFLLVVIGTKDVRHDDGRDGQRSAASSHRGGMAPDGSREAFVRAAVADAVVPAASHAGSSPAAASASVTPFVVPAHRSLRPRHGFTFARPFDPPHLHPFALLI